MDAAAAPEGSSGAWRALHSGTVAMILEERHRIAGSLSRAMGARRQHRALALALRAWRERVGRARGARRRFRLLEAAQRRRGRELRARVLRAWRLEAVEGQSARALADFRQRAEEQMLSLVKRTLGEYDAAVASLAQSYMERERGGGSSQPAAAERSEAARALAEERPAPGAGAGGVSEGVPKRKAKQKQGKGGKGKNKKKKDASAEKDKDKDKEREREKIKQPSTGLPPRARTAAEEQAAMQQLMESELRKLGLESTDTPQVGQGTQTHMIVCLTVVGGVDGLAVAVAGKEVEGMGKVAAAIVVKVVPDPHVAAQQRPGQLSTRLARGLQLLADNGLRTRSAPEERSTSGPGGCRSCRPPSRTRGS